MPISEAARSELYTGLSEVLGQDRAETLMSAIPLHDLDEVATKSDIQALRAEIKADFVRLTLVLIGGLLAVIATLIGVGLSS